MNADNRKRDGRKLRPWLVPHVRPTLLAKAAGCSSQYVYDVLSGKKPASRRLLAAARKMGVPVDTLYGEDEA